MVVVVCVCVCVSKVVVELAVVDMACVLTRQLTSSGCMHSQKLKYFELEQACAHICAFFAHCCSISFAGSKTKSTLTQYQLGFHDTNSAKNQARYGYFRNKS